MAPQAQNLAQLPDELLHEVFANLKTHDIASLRVADKQTQGLVDQSLGRKNQQKLLDLKQRHAALNRASPMHGHYEKLLNHPPSTDALAQSVFLKRMDVELLAEERIEQVWGAVSVSLNAEITRVANTDLRYRALIPGDPNEFGSETAKVAQILLWELPKNAPDAMSRQLIDSLVGVVKESLPDASPHECLRVLTRAAMGAGADQDRQASFLMALKAYTPALWTAHYSGNFEAVEAFVKEGMQIDRPYPYMGPPTVLASMVRKGASTAEIKRMVEWGADPNGGVSPVTGQAVWFGLKSYPFKPPVCMAVEQGQVEMLDTLLKLGADDFDSGRGGWSLQSAISAHQNAEVKAQLQKVYQSHKQSTTPPVRA